LVANLGTQGIPLVLSYIWTFITGSEEGRGRINRAIWCSHAENSQIFTSTNVG